MCLLVACGDSATPGGGDDDAPAGVDASTPAPSADASPPPPTPDATPEPPEFTGDPEQDGSFAVFEQSVSIPGPVGNLDATVYAPSSDGGTTIATADGPFPVVIVMPAFTTPHTNYAVFARHLATWGFLCVGFDFTEDGEHEQSANEAIATIDWALSDPLTADAADSTRIATAGHSLGGKISFFTAVLDSRVTAVVGWDPVDSGGPPCFIDPDGCHRWSIAPNGYDGDEGRMDEIDAAILIFAAPSGAFNPTEHHAERFWEGAESPAMYVMFPNGGHLNWPNGNPEQRISKRTHTAWLLRHLYGMSGLEPFLTGEAMQADVVAGRVSVAQK